MFTGEVYLINHVRGSGGISLVAAMPVCVVHRSESAEVPAT